MKVFLHGVPETASIWDEVRAAIDDDSMAFALPGFGCDHPAGFEPTKDGYVAWVVQGLEAIGEPVDLVGHDWGAGLTYRIATAHGDLLRSWVADVGNIAHPDYEWHDFARTWQTPSEGEASFAAQLAMPASDMAAVYEAMGIPAAGARHMAEAADQTMADSILGLYRSAVPNPHADWGPWSPTSAPGMIVHVAGDPFSDERLAGEVAEQLGARLEVLEDSGHFWPYEAPQAGAALLQRFWSDLA
jgi:pimeloyl-ACP methyl ester carboxylesterase